MINLIKDIRTYLFSPQHRKLFSIAIITAIALAIPATTFLSQQQQSLRQRAVTPSCTQEGEACTNASGLSGTCTVNKIIGAFECLLSGDYKPTSVIVAAGQTVSGDYSSLSSKDSSSLIINATLNSDMSTYQIDWYAEFALPSRQVNSLNITYAGSYSRGIGNILFLYDFTASKWKQISQNVVGPSLVTIGPLNISTPANYISPEGNLRLRIYASSLASFTGYTDLLKIGAVFSDAPIPTSTPTPASTTFKIRDQLSSCINLTNSVWVARNGKYYGYSPTAPDWANDLKEIFPKEEVLLKLTNNCILTYNNYTYNLVSGNNTFIWEPTPTPTPTKVPAVAFTTSTPDFCSNACVADINKDGVVNSSDWNAVVTQCWNKPATGICVNADTDKNGVVNSIDLNCVIRNYRKKCP